jgi:hypothetical protein
MADPCNRSGNDLHGHANDPSRHDHGGPGNVRILAEHNQPTEAKAENAARNVPTALRNSAVSILPAVPPFADGLFAG